MFIIIFESNTLLKARRPSGGIYIVIRKNLRNPCKKSKGVKFIKDNEYMTWVKLSKDTLNTDNDIFICAAYFPPENSTYYSEPSHKDTLQKLVRYISNFMVEGDIILLGDFNAV